MQKEPIRDLDVVREALAGSIPDPAVLSLLGTTNLAALGHAVNSVVVAHSGTAQLAAYNGLLSFVGDIVTYRRDVFASEALYDEIRDVLKPYVGQLRQSRTPQQLQAAYVGLCNAIVILATPSSQPADNAGTALSDLNPDTSRIQALEQENLQLHRRVAELEAARRAYASEFPLTEDGEPDVGSIHANIRKMKADLAKAG
jgi:hypothetical protein